MVSSHPLIVPKKIPINQWVLGELGNTLNRSPMMGRLLWTAHFRQPLPKIRKHPTSTAGRGRSRRSGGVEDGA